MTDADQQLWELLEQVADDRLDEDAAQKLEEVLLNDPAARRIYAKFMLLDAELCVDTAKHFHLRTCRLHRPARPCTVRVPCSGQTLGEIVGRRRARCW